MPPVSPAALLKMHLPPRLPVYRCRQRALALQSASLPSVSCGAKCCASIEIKRDHRQDHQQKQSSVPASASSFGQTDAVQGEVRRAVA
ncbi:hypothetical protein CSOJ01_14753 [Colletotrichum sojae]|uniref:Uncharacterized protein n=1 Tax=Colletotrichum sojae TaxID=2175907 RepID=A0A8H6MIP2_9PEZI|nr:hypothetical protein CSOJ01_14753 [Colletotrichum sojae]